MKILFLTLYPSHQPSTRFRVYQFLSYLKDHSYTIKSAVPEKLFKRLYGSPKRLERIAFHLVEFFYRLFWILRAGQYDLVFLQKGVATVNYRFFDLLLALVQKNVIFDLDDAITIEAVSRLTKFPWNILDDQGQTFKIARRAKKIFVGNARLKKDLEDINPNVIVIPTPVDTRYYPVRDGRYDEKKQVNIIWSGNKSAHYLMNIAVPAVLKLSKKYDLRFTVLSDSRTPGLDKLFNGMDYQFVEWSYENEKRVFDAADIGIMPLTDTLWNRRKCAFKGLLYMANGIPAVSSPVGVVNEFMRDGENAFLADSEAEWYEKLERLIKDRLLRKKIGLNGRATIEKDFSLARWGTCWSEAIKIG